MSGDRGCFDVLVIGAGPAGLAVADAVSGPGDLSVAILERDRVGATWHRSPPNLRVLSPWWTNILSSADLLRHNPFGLVVAKDYLRHLERFAESRKLSVRAGIDVVSVRRDGQYWQATDSSGGAWRARQLVAATGYFSAPAMPVPSFENDGSIPLTHANEVDNYDSLADRLQGQRVLIVGGRVTAGQTMVELAGRGVRVMLSASSPLAFHRSGPVAHLIDQLYFVYEALRIRVQPQLKSDSYPPMEGGATRRLIESGQVRHVARLSSIKNRFALLQDGERVEVDHVILATGYRPALPYLDQESHPAGSNGLPEVDDFEVVGAPGLYLLGYDNLRNFRSRYLRGIRSDARMLARKIRLRALLQAQEKGAG